MQAVKCAILLEISSGAAKRLPFSTESLKDDNVVAIMDEIHEVIWLWMGQNTGLVMRRGSMRAARSLKAYGHEIGPAIVGRKLKDVIPVDGLRIDSDPEEKSKFEKILSLFTREHTIKADVLAEFVVTADVIQHKYYGLSKSQRDDLVQAAISAPSAGDDARKIEEIVGEFRPSVPKESSTASVVPKVAPKPAPPPVVKPTPPPAPKVEITPPPMLTTETFEIPDNLPGSSSFEIPADIPEIMPEEALLGEIKAAIVMTSVLSEYSDIFIGLKSEGGHKVFKLEGPEGLICQFSLDQSKIQFLPGSWEKVDPTIKRNIQKLFIERVKKLLG